MIRALRWKMPARHALVLTLLMGAVGQAGAVCGDAGTPCALEPGVAAQAADAPVNAGAGNPIHVVSGNKYQQEVDLPALPGVLGIEIVRHYNSSLSTPRHLPGPMGRGWRLSYETELSVAGNTIRVTQADGSALAFGRDLLDPTLARTIDPARGAIRISKSGRGDQYTWTWPDGRRLSFDQKGKLVQIQAATGEILSLQHDARGLLTRVTDPQGRVLRFNWLDHESARAGDRFRGVHSIDTPVGRFNYEHGSALPKGGLADRRLLLSNLAGVRYPQVPGMAHSGRRYHYESVLQPTLLTGISLEGEDGSGKPLRARDATYGYRGDGRAVLSTHAAGANKVTLDFSEHGQTVVTNSLGQKTRYRHAEVGNAYRILEVRGAGCSWCGEVNVRYRYDQAGRMTRTEKLDLAGNTLYGDQFELDRIGRTLRITRTPYANGKAQPAYWRQRYEYASALASNPSLVAQPSVVRGKEFATRYTYNASGQRLSMSQTGWAPAPDTPARPIARTTSYRYRTIKGRSLLAAIDGPLPNGRTGSPADSDVTVFEYDGRGHFLTRSVAPGNVVTEVKERDGALRAALVAISDGVRLVQAATTFAAQGQALALTETAWMLDKAGKPDAGTRTIRAAAHRYDAQGRQSELHKGGHRLLRYLYDTAGNMTHTILPDQSQSTRSFDTEGRLLTQAEYGPGGSAGRQRSYKYDGEGDVAGVSSSATPSDGDGSQLTMSFDVTGERGEGGALRRAWDNAAQAKAIHHGGAAGSIAEQAVLAVTRPDGSEVRRWVDDFERISATRSPEKGIVTGSHDNAGNLVSLHDARGVRTSILRDGDGRALQVDRIGSDGARNTIVYRYRGAALASQAVFDNGRLDNEVRWNSDVWGQPNGKTLLVSSPDKAAPALSLGSAMRTDTDAYSILKTLPSGIVLRYRFNTANKIVAVELEGKPLISAIRHGTGALGSRPIEFTYANGLKALTRFDPSGRLASHASGVDKLVFEYGPGQSIARIERQRIAQQQVAAQAGRLSFPELISSAQAATAAPQTVVLGVDTYRYDAAARLVGERWADVARPDLAYDLLGNRQGAPAAHTDAGGNVLSQRGLTFEYNPAGHLVRVRDSGGTTKASYRYDADGMRVAKVAHGHTTYYLYDDGQLLAEANGTGRITAEYIYLGQRPIARLRHSRPADKIAAVLAGAVMGGPVVEYLHADHRHAVEAATDASGKLVWQGRLDAFGNLVSEHGRKGEMPLRLSGQYADRETGLYYNVHRYYDPQGGRYLQADPLGIAAGLNMYAYVLSDPLQKTDPLGLIAEPDDGFAGTFTPWLFGTLVHSQMALQIRNPADGWGANDQRGGTWNALRPDAYHIDKINRELENKKLPFKGELWELKPISWSAGMNSLKYGAGKTEVAVYIANAKRGCWTAGSSKAVVDKLLPATIPMNGEFYNVAFVPDVVNDKSGLLFYTKMKLEQKPAPGTVKAPVLTKDEENELKATMEKLQAQGGKEGWSTAAKVGMVILVMLAIAAMLWFSKIVVAISAILMAIGQLISMAAAGMVQLMAALAAMFALAPATAAEAEKKAEEKDKGLLDGTIDWFKSWFK